jgi:hypothetical protein
MGRTFFLFAFVICCFAQASTLRMLSRDYAASPPPIADDPVYAEAVVNSGARAAPCFFKNDPEVRIDKLVADFRRLGAPEPLVSADACFVVWWATNTKDCGAFDNYRRVTGNADCLLTTNANIGFSAWECGSAHECAAFDRSAKYAVQVGDTQNRGHTTRGLRFLSSSRMVGVFLGRK